MPLAAYGGSGMDDDADAPTTDTATATALEPGAPAQPRAGAEAGNPGATPAENATADLPVPEDEPPHGPGPVARVVHLFRTSRVAVGTGFAVVIVVGLVLLSGGGASPAATAATPTNGPTAAPTITPPSGEASLVLSGGVTGTFPLSGLAGGQHVDGGAVNLGWGDTQQTTLTITGPLDRGTRTTDERLVLVITALVDGAPVTFTSNAGQCTVGMAQVATRVQGSITCHRLKSPDGKLSIEVSGTYRT
jgi:hypothetical protein